MHAVARQYFKPLAVTLAVLILSFFLHWKWCGTAMTHPEKVWQHYLQLHTDWYPFSIRYLTSYPVLFMSEVFSLPVRESFFMLQFSLAVAIGLVFYRYLRVLGFGDQQSAVGVFLLLSAYPILCAHFEPVHTWDDFWAYLFVILAHMYVVKGKRATGMIFLTLGCFAREQSLIFYPILAAAVLWQSKGSCGTARFVSLLLPLVIYGAFTIAVWQDPDPKRLRLLSFNFEHWVRTRDTIYSVFISFGSLWVMSALGLMRVYRTRVEPVSRLLFWGAVVTAPVTVLTALLFAFARETRILFPPFVYLLPLALVEMNAVYTVLKRTKGWQRRLTQAGAVCILLAIGFYLGKLAFPYFEYRNCGRFAQQWAGVHVGVIVCLFAWYGYRRLDRGGTRPLSSGALADREG